MKLLYTLIWVCALAALPTAKAHAQTPPSLSVTLDQATTTEGQCSLVFVLQNQLDQGIDSLQAEVVLLSPQTRVLRLAVLDFQALPKDALRVRSFNLPGLACAEVGRVLINALQSCAPLSAPECSANLRVASAIDIEVLK